MPYVDDDNAITEEPGMMNRGIGIKDIVMNHFNKITELSAVEFRGGFYIETTSPDGQVKKTYVPDTRETYSNAIYQLSIILEPRFDDKMKIAVKEFEEALTKLKNDFMVLSTIKEHGVILGEGFYKSLDDKIYLETYKQKKLEIYIKFLLALSKQLARLKYFEMMGITVKTGGAIKEKDKIVEEVIDFNKPEKKSE